MIQLIALYRDGGKVRIKVFSAQEGQEDEVKRQIYQEVGGVLVTISRVIEGQIDTYHKILIDRQ